MWRRCRLFSIFVSHDRKFVISSWLQLPFPALRAHPIVHHVGTSTTAAAQSSSIPLAAGRRRQESAWGWYAIHAVGDFFLTRLRYLIVHSRSSLQRFAIFRFQPVYPSLRRAQAREKKGRNYERLAHCALARIFSNRYRLVCH